MLAEDCRHTLTNRLDPVTSMIGCMGIVLMKVFWILCYFVFGCVCTSNQKWAGELEVLIRFKSSNEKIQLGLMDDRWSFVGRYSDLNKDQLMHPIEYLVFLGYQIMILSKSYLARKDLDTVSWCKIKWNSTSKRLSHLDLQLLDLTIPYLITISTKSDNSHRLPENEFEAKKLVVEYYIPKDIFEFVKETKFPLLPAKLSIANDMDQGFRLRDIVWDPFGKALPNQKSLWYFNMGVGLEVLFGVATGPMPHITRIHGLLNLAKVKNYWLSINAITDSTGKPFGIPRYKTSFLSQRNNCGTLECLKGLIIHNVMELDATNIVITTSPFSVSIYSTSPLEDHHQAYFRQAFESTAKINKLSLSFASVNTELKELSGYDLVFFKFPFKPSLFENEEDGLIKAFNKLELKTLPKNFAFLNLFSHTYKHVYIRKRPLDEPFPSEGRGKEGGEGGKDGESAQWTILKHWIYIGTLSRSKDTTFFLLQNTLLNTDVEFMIVCSESKEHEIEELIWQKSDHSIEMNCANADDFEKYLYREYRQVENFAIRIRSLLEGADSKAKMIGIDHYTVDEQVIDDIRPLLSLEHVNDEFGKWDLDLSMFGSSKRMTIRDLTIDQIIFLSEAVSFQSPNFYFEIRAQNHESGTNDCGCLSIPNDSDFGLRELLKRLLLVLFKYYSKRHLLNNMGLFISEQRDKITCCLPATSRHGVITEILRATIYEADGEFLPNSDKLLRKPHEWSFEYGSSSAVRYASTSIDSMEEFDMLMGNSTIMSKSAYMFIVDKAGFSGLDRCKSIYIIQAIDSHADLMKCFQELVRDSFSGAEQKYSLKYALVTKSQPRPGQHASKIELAFLPRSKTAIEAKVAILEKMAELLSGSSFEIHFKKP